MDSAEVIQDSPVYVDDSPEFEAESLPQAPAVSTGERGQQPRPQQ